ncbi:MAG: hypothetical protein ABSA73_13550 [Terracidiphilus sp.]|jgi:hypothetical protein
MMADQTLFHGIAVVIDDEIHNPEASIREIQSAIEEAGCHVVPLEQIPSDASVSNLREVAFFVLDWNLYGATLKEAAAGDSIDIPAGVKEANEESIIKFLRELKKVRFAPVFIFTDEPVGNIVDKLKKHADLYDEADPSHILVKSKRDVLKAGIFEVLSTWMEQAPSVYVLKKWERAYSSAKNELFLDFYAKSVHWPLVLWNTYKEDHVPPSAELGNLIGRNLLSRMIPFDFDLSSFDTAFKTLETEESKSRDAVIKVLEGERFLLNNRLRGNMLAPGDVFKKDKHYYVNIRPDCDCIAREGEVQAEIKAYLLKGSKVTNAKIDKLFNEKYGNIFESDTESVIFGMTAGTTVSFQLRELLVEASGGWMEHRIGRLLPPYLTRLQQRYSAYIQRPGLSRIPRAALPIIPPPVSAARAPEPVLSVPELAKASNARKSAQGANKKASPKVSKRKSAS